VNIKDTLEKGNRFLIQGFTTEKKSGIEQMRQMSQIAMRLDMKTMDKNADKAVCASLSVRARA
jgi:hypothetical protein